MRLNEIGRRGVASMLAMLYLVLFTVLAVGFYAASATSVQISSNEERTARAVLAAETGLDFMQFQMAGLNLPYGTTTANLMDRVASALAYNLNTTPNMGGSTVTNTGGTIYIPSQTGWIFIGGRPNTRFQATITQTPGTTRLVVTVRGCAVGSTLVRGMRMSFVPESASYALAGLNGITMSLNAFTDSYDSSTGSYSAATARKNGSIVSNGHITLSNTVRINGDARPGIGKTLTIKDSAVVTGRRNHVPAPLSYPSVTLPAGGYTSLGTVNTTSGTQNLPGGVYVIDHLTLGGSAIVNWQGPVTIYVRYSYNVSGGVVINTYQGKPANRKIYFLPTCTTATWSGSNTCIGDLYAPDTDFTISGSVRKLGRITARSINNSSSGGMHADEALPNPGGAGSYLPDASSYTEL
jgi:hypothetical protein